MEDATRKFTALDSKAEMREILSSVYNSLMVKGYNPINQIVGYLLSLGTLFIAERKAQRSVRVFRAELRGERKCVSPVEFIGKGEKALFVFFSLAAGQQKAKGEQQRKAYTFHGTLPDRRYPSLCAFCHYNTGALFRQIKVQTFSQTVFEGKFEKSLAFKRRMC